MKKKFTTGLLTCKKQPASRKFPGILKFVFALPFIFLLLISLQSSAQDLMIRDCINDEINNGAEPSSTCTNAIYSSDGIKITQNPYAGYTPYPFTTGIADAWSLVPDEDAEYRDPALYSKPNWIYVKVSNPVNASGPSNGTEVLKVYWAKGSTGLTWPNMWKDYFATITSCTNIYLGDEVTKPRPNWTSLTQAEKTDVVSAFQQLDLISYQDGVSFWDKQDQIHQETHIHGGTPFLPWHRELVNRFENLLRTVRPNIKLPYWDWTTDPRPGGSDILLNIGDTPNQWHFGLPGPIGTPVGYPFDTFDNGGNCNGNERGQSICNACASPYDPSLPPVIIERDVTMVFPIDPDQTIVTSADFLTPHNQQFPYFKFQLENNHNNTHGNIGGNIGAGHCSFEDPFVFVLHSNVDRLFSKWQRNLATTPNDYLYRLDNSTTINGIYGDDAIIPIELCPDPDQFGGAPPQLLNPIEPWANNHLTGNTNPICTPTCVDPVRPWMNPDDEELYKTYFDPSVVSPPIYDNARLTIPILNPGESVIMQVPWYPPFPDNYQTCFTDWHHFCILARIETDVNPPYGMTTVETADVGHNAYWNNNIAWKNIQLYDAHPGSQLIACVIVRNMQKERSIIKLRIGSEEKGDFSYFKHGQVILDIHDKIYDLWVAGGKVGKDFKDMGEGHVELLTEKAWLGNIDMDKDEQREVCLIFNTVTVPATGKAFHINLEQTDDKGFMGGEQFQLRYEKGGRYEKNSASSSKTEYTVSPNPMQSVFSIVADDNNSSENSVFIYDVLGQEVYQEKFNAKTNISVEKFQCGIYMLKIVNTNNNHEFFQKIVKN